MARKCDRGPYSPENVYCATWAENAADRDRDTMIEAFREGHARRKKAGIVHHLAVRGDSHPRAKAVITPMGRFGSARLASEAHGISDHRGQYWAQHETHGWRYETAADRLDATPDALEKFEATRALMNRALAG